MKPGYQEQILYILNKHHSIVTIELGDAVTDDILQLIDTAKREAIENHPIISLLHELDDTLPEGKYSTITMQYMPGGKAKLEQSEESE